MAATYGISPLDVPDLTMPQITMLLESVPARDLEKEIQLAQLLSMVANIGRESGEGPKPRDFLGHYARAFIPTRYPPHVVKALRFVGKNRLLPQRAIDLVEWENL